MCSDTSDDGFEHIQDTVNPDKIIYTKKELRRVSHGKEMYVFTRDHLRHGIRAKPNMTCVDCTKTVFKCHNETANIWTHLLAAIYFGTHFVLLFNPQKSDVYS
jgi:adiponectin receptor